MAIKKARERGKSRSLEHEVPRTPGWEKKKRERECTWKQERGRKVA